VSADVSALKAEIDALSPPARIRLAADLLEHGKAELAHTILERATTELGAALALDALRRAGGAR
jgi:hypothetical protein